MDNKITIIEGPPPIFEPTGDAWASGVAESPTYGSVVLTRLRTFNGPALVERCHRAWRSMEPIHLEFRSNEGLVEYRPIIAARHVDTNEGHMLFLWVRLSEDDVQLEIEYDDDDDDLGEDSNDDLPPDDRY
jgi:hypothetical protein